MPLEHLKPSLHRALALTPFLLGAVLLGCNVQVDRDVAAPQNFIYFGLDRERIAEPGFLESESIMGAQLKYRWPELEPERDSYDLEMILQDLAFLESHGKRLFVQLQDVSFETSIINVPRYLRTDPAFGGGVARQYEDQGSGDTIPVAEGWVARRWDPAVRDRFIRLLQALGVALDGRIEGLNLPETAIGVGETSELRPPDFTYYGYLQAIKELMTAAREAFPRSHVIQYANFMPGEGLPDNDHGYLRAVYEHAARTGVGVGGPDLLPHREGQRSHSYPLIANRARGVVAGIAVQWGNLDDRNPVTGEQVTVDELYRFARDSLRLDYVFWGTQEPDYSEQILPYLNALGRGAVG
jgi:hypothetical protein